MTYHHRNNPRFNRLSPTVPIHSTPQISRSITKTLHSWSLFQLVNQEKTGSGKGSAILKEWDKYLPLFWQLVPPSEDDTPEACADFDKTVSGRLGKIFMVDAERRLLANALKDRDNQHFVLLPDSCAPLHDFDYIFRYLMHTNVSFVDCFEDPGVHGSVGIRNICCLKLRKRIFGRVFSGSH